MLFADDPHAITLAAFRLRPPERFLYTSDLGDGWQHEVRLEQMLVVEPGRAYPICIGGQQAGPPEDCGGPAGSWRRQRESASVAAFDDLGRIAAFVRRWLETDERGTPEEQAEIKVALERAQARARFIAGRFSRRAINAELGRAASEPSLSSSAPGGEHAVQDSDGGRRP